jgi:hypothetical protein
LILGLLLLASVMLAIPDMLNGNICVPLGPNQAPPTLIDRVVALVVGKVPPRDVPETVMSPLTAFVTAVTRAVQTATLAPSI